MIDVGDEDDDKEFVFGTKSGAAAKAARDRQTMTKKTTAKTSLQRHLHSSSYLNVQRARPQACPGFSDVTAAAAGFSPQGAPKVGELPSSGAT